MATSSTSRPDDASADRLVDDATLKVVWRQIGSKWKWLGRELQIPDSKLDGIVHQYRTEGTGELAYQMLRAWREAASSRATVAFLSAQLEEVGRTDLAQQIMKMVQIRKDDNRSRNQGEVLPTSETDRQVDNAILRAVCYDISGRWRELGRLLLVPDSKLDNIFQQCYTQGGLPELAYQTLLAWREAASTNASLSVLTTQLKEIGRQDVADKILKMPSKSSNGNGYPNQSQELSEAEWLKRLRNNLCNKYETYVMKGLPWMGHIRISLADYYVTLSVETDDSNNTRMPSNRRKGHSTIGATMKEKDANEVFHSAFSSNKRPLRVLVEGPPGYGKTTLSAKLCFDHASSADYMKKNFDLVLHYPLRSFEGNLEEMLCRAADLADSHERKIFLGILNNPSTSILLVLDGYDEVPHQHVKPIRALLQGQRFRHVAVVVTSRTGYFTFEMWEKEKDGCAAQCEFTRDWNRLWQSRITVLGISKQMKALFIIKHLAGFPENIRSQVSSELQQLEYENIIESKFLECPLFLLMLILLATGEETGGICNLRAPTDLFKSIFNFIIRRYCTKQNEPVNEKVDLFAVSESPKSFYVDLLCQFGDFALWALTGKKLSFSEEEILGSDQRDPRILKLGLLTQSVSTVGFMEKVVYEPVHKSLLEFSAAFALWQQFAEGDRDSWAEKVVGLWRCERYGRPFWFIMLEGLMRDRFAAFLDALNPYASCGVWEKWLRSSVNEIELTESVLSSLTPFLPTHWEQGSESQPDVLLLHGIRAGRIKQVTRYTFLAIPMPHDVVVDTAEFSFGEDAAVNVRKFNCRRLVFCRLSPFHGLDTWIPLINFQTLSLELIEIPSRLLNVCLHLHQLRSAIAAGALKDIQIHISCKIEQTAVVVALTELIKMEKLQALYLYGTPLGSEELNDLLRAAANSSQLTRLLFRGLRRASADLCHLFGGVQKTWQFLSITHCEIEFSPQTDQTFQANCLVLDSPDIPAAFLRSLEVCQITSLQCRLPLLADLETLPQLLTELNVILVETIVVGQRCRLPHLPNLTVLILTMDSSWSFSFAVRDFLFGSRSFLRLKGIEIWKSTSNWELSVEFMKCVSGFLEQSIPVPTTGEGTLHRSHSLQLEYFLIEFQYSYKDYFACLGEMATLLRNKSLSRLDIVLPDYPNFADLLDWFSPSQGFRIETFLWGARTEDTILRRMQRDTEYALFFHYYSIQFP